MVQARHDALLTAARICITLAQVLIIIGLVGIGIALAAMVFGHAQVAAELGKEGVPASAYWGIVAALLFGWGILALWERFVVTLRRIIDSVGAGDPFIPENAARLTRMGGMALGAFVLSLPLGLISGWVKSVSGSTSLDIDFGGGTAGLVLAVTLFILARVFRHGTALREDLEGTV